MRVSLQERNTSEALFRGKGRVDSERAVNAIILLEGSQAFPDRPSGSSNLKRKALQWRETGTRNFDCLVNVKCIIWEDNLAIFRGRCLILMNLNKECCKKVFVVVALKGGGGGSYLSTCLKRLNYKEETLMQPGLKL